MDGYYYTTNGARLANGWGLTEEVIWQFLDNPTGLPTPSHSYWMPAASFITAFGYQFGDGFRAAQWPFWLLSGLLPILTYLIAVQLNGQRWQAISSGLLTAAGGFYAGWLNQPSTFAPFAWFGAGCLLFLMLAFQAGGGKNWLLAGVMAGLAHLTRADGLLLFGVGGLLLVWVGLQRKEKPLLLYSGAFFAGYLLIMVGWFWRNFLVWQRPLSTAGTQTIFLTQYDDLFAFGRSFDLDHLLAWGWGNIFSSRVDAVWVAAQTFLAVNCLIFLFPFVIWGWSAVRKQENRLLAPLILYTVSLFATMSLVFTFPGQRGGLFHSSVAIWPWCMALAPIGVQHAVNWMAQKLPHWQPERAGRFFMALFVAVAFLLTGAVNLSRQSEDIETGVYQEWGTQLPPDAVVMVGNPPKFNYHTGLAAISVPNEPPSILFSAADTFGVNYLILDKHVPLPLTDFYQMEDSISRFDLIDQIDEFKLYQIYEPTQ